MWVLEQDNSLLSITIPSVTIALNAKHCFQTTIPPTLELISGDQSEWNEFFGSILFIILKSIDMLITFYLIIWSVYGFFKDFNRHQRRFSKTTSVPEFTQIALFFAYSIGLIIPVFPDARDSTFVNQLSYEIMGDIGLILGLQSVCIFFISWDVVVMTYENSFNQAHFDRSDKRFLLLTITNIIVWITVVSLRSSFPQSLPNLYISAGESIYLAVMISVVSFRAAVAGSRLTAIKSARFNSPNNQFIHNSPFYKMIKVARAFVAVSVIIPIILLATYIVVSSYQLIYWKSIHWIRHGVFYWIGFFILKHLGHSRNPKRDRLSEFGTVAL